MQSVAERREQAARRRRAEQQAAIDAAVTAERQRSQREWEEYFQTADIRNPYDGNRPITNRAEYEAYLKARDGQALERNLRAGKLTPDLLEKAVENSPTVKAARRIMEERETQTRMDAQSRRYAEVDRQFEELQRFDPTVKSLEQLMTGEQAEEFRQNVAATRNLTKAYKLTFFDELAARGWEAAARGQEAKGAGKAHLHRLGTRGGGAPVVTRETIDAYRAIDPDVTLEEIRQYEAKYQKNRKKE